VATQSGTGKEESPRQETNKKASADAEVARFIEEISNADNLLLFKGRCDRPFADAYRFAN
jgi:hypothetical protein